jgi:molybdenum cofactor cytidylyltransferase
MLSQTVAVVLAAGRGARMGGPKALMRMPSADGEGTPWWKFQEAALGRIGVRSVWVVSEVVEATVRDAADKPRRLVVADSGAPMFVSLVCGVQEAAALRPAGVFVLPVDVPVPAAAVWEALAGAGEVVVPEFQGRRGHPVYLPWGFAERLLGEAARAGADAGRMRLDELIAPVVRPVAVLDGSIAVNLNTPEDVRRYVAGW